MKLDLKIIIILGLFLYVIFLQNSSRKINKEDDVETVITIDTLRSTFVDTVIFVDTIVHRIIVKIKKPVVISDSIKEYTNDFTDSLLSGSVWTQVNGILLDQEIDYTPKFPQYIFQIDTVIINTSQTTTRFVSRFSLNIGIEAGGNADQFNFSPIIGLTNKRGNSYSYRYGLLDKTHSIGMMYNFKIGQ